MTGVWKRRWHLGGVLCALLGLSACTTTREVVTQAVTPPPAQFEPLTYVAQVQQDDGRYANLFAPTSFAVWVGPEVSEFKRTMAAQSGQPIEPWLENVAAVVPSNYIVIECHVESAFADASVAYDAVALRGMEAYLELPDGRIVKPIQQIIDARARETAQGTLKSFGRTNLLVFARKDLLLGQPTVPASAPEARLVLDGFDSRFHFNWEGLGGPRPSPWVPAAQEAGRAAQLGYNELYDRLKALAHIFD